MSKTRWLIFIVACILITISSAFRIKNVLCVDSKTDAGFYCKLFLGDSSEK